MKRYVVGAGQAWQTYKGVKIYDDGVFYIYTEPQGKGRVDFSNAKEAIDYIDDNMNQATVRFESTPSIKSCKYRVDFYNSVDQVASIEVDANSIDNAKRAAKSLLGGECKYIIRVVKLH